jgi:hypothetical protein
MQVGPLVTLPHQLMRFLHACMRGTNRSGIRSLAPSLLVLSVPEGIFVQVVISVNPYVEFYPFAERVEVLPDFSPRPCCGSSWCKCRDVPEQQVVLARSVQAWVFEFGQAQAHRVSFALGYLSFSNQRELPAVELTPALLHTKHRRWKFLCGTVSFFFTLCSCLLA